MSIFIHTVYIREIHSIQFDWYVILDIPKREVESKLINQSSDSLLRSKAARASMRLGVPYFWHVLIDL